MKKYTLSLLLLLFVAALAAPGDKRYTVGLAWDVYDWGEASPTNSGFILYEQAGTNWLPVVAAPAAASTLTLTGVSPGRHTYALTATNYWGESDLSNPATTPRYPGKPINLRIP